MIMRQNYIDVNLIIIFRLTYNPIVIFQFWGANGASCHLKLVQCTDINNPKSTEMGANSTELGRSPGTISAIDAGFPGLIRGIVTNTRCLEAEFEFEPILKYNFPSDAPIIPGDWGWRMCSPRTPSCIRRSSSLQPRSRAPPPSMSKSTHRRNSNDMAPSSFLHPIVIARFASIRYRTDLNNLNTYIDKKNNVKEH
ncbi:hypothetical protein AGLY_003057 [Aphis glycines]|uniref:Uncharacterized protein n=1 Tax=Aphis glycines TaxID=307491 RepID=A0A6G0U4J7_APHGL|nr:hypothetical protein AGLY_003057 [Aphis glycines]